MKILHTSDWHLGHSLVGYDRTEEQQKMLDQMVAIVRKHRPDIFLLAGDVYHTSQPATAVQRMFNQTMVRLHDAHPGMTVIVTAGNHDSGSRHEIFRTPWEYLNVRMVGTFDRNNPERHIIEIAGIGYVIAVPYTNERYLQEGLLQHLIDKAGEMNTDNLPVVLTAHTSVSGADFTGHENATEKTIGGIDAVDIKEIGTGYDYLALGHIHRPQFVHTGRHNARYSGSPLPVSFDECYGHTVSLVEIDRHGGTPAVETIAIDNPRPMTTLPLEGVASWEEAKKMLMDFPDDLPDYIRLNIDGEGVIPVQAKQEAMQITQNKQCRFCLLNVVKRKTERNTARQVTIQEFRQMDPIEVAEMFAKDTDEAFDGQMREMMKEVIKSLDESEL